MPLLSTSPTERMAETVERRSGIMRAGVHPERGGAMQLPVEVKGQWHEEVWDAATNQLDAQYLIDWRCEERGIYCVLWFGDLPSGSKRRLKAHPDGISAPASAAELRTMLITRIPEARRALINVVVFDFTAGRS